ncbi:MAG: phosphoribosyltransferase family protein [Hydrogenothermaceae bacterium]|nr:phosphoribosyltransferase family protein [Hydrogenothermaceae bacterium]
MRFINKEEAGNLLVESLEKIPVDKENTIILAIPRGGVLVAYQISKKLKMPFSLIVAKKLAPISDPEAAFGAITTDGTFLLDKELMRYMGVYDSQLEKN